MLLDIIDAQYVDGFKIRLKFEDGKAGVVDLASFSKDGIFSELSDIDYFKRFYVNPELGTVCWPNGQDIAPETLYERAQLCS